MGKQPLVSVIVVCYNSAEFIVETLESIKAQTYKNIEVIVTDDCSRDNTVDIARSWIIDNEHLFIRSEVITVEHNAGVPANYNRGVGKAKGEWIKFIDGDDILSKDCISNFVSFVREKPEIEVAFSYYGYFRTNTNDVQYNSRRNLYNYFSSFSPREQYLYLLRENIIPSPTCFIKASIFNRFYFNEKYKFLEDEPFWINLTRNGVKLYYLDKITALYRVGESLSKSIGHYFSPRLLENSRKFFWNEKIDYIKEIKDPDIFQENRRYFLFLDLVEGFLHNKKSRVNSVVFKIIHWIVYHFSKFEMF